MVSHHRSGVEPELDTSDPMPPLEGDEDHHQQVTTSAESSQMDTQDIFLLLNLPPNTTVGCDARAIGTGPSSPSTFQGLRDIPRGGAHFLWVSAPGAMSRCGFWFVTGATSPEEEHKVHVKQWDAFNEFLVTPPPGSERVVSVADVYSRLVPYGFDGVAASGAAAGKVQRIIEEVREEAEPDAAQQLWRRLTACVGEKVLARVTGTGTGGGTSEWLVDTADGAVGDTAGGFLQSTRTKVPTPATEAATAAGELHFLFPEGDVDVHTIVTGTGTNNNTKVPDTSMDILRLIDTPGTGITQTDILGELQFTFLTGLHLSNFACIEQWWHLVLKVVLRAHKLVLLRPSLSKALLATLYDQMVYNEDYIGGSSSAGGELGGDAARREYGGPGDAGGGGATSLLDVIPGTKRRLRAALALYGRQMRELLREVPGGQVTPEQGEVGAAFAEIEELFWKFGWDLRTEHGEGSKAVEKGDAEEVGDEEEDDYRPVVVYLDDDGRELGFISFS